MANLRDRLLSRLPWLLAFALVLVALRPTWGVPLFSDDVWLVFLINGDPNVSVWENAFNYTRAWMALGTHYNPVSYYLDSLLKGGMLASTSTVFTPTVMHYGVIAVCSLLTLVAVTRLATRLLRVAAGKDVPAAWLSVVLALGFLASLQLTSIWSNYDPVIYLPIFGAFATMVGFVYLALAVIALSNPRGWRSVAVAAVAGVFAFLTYEVSIVFVAAVAGICIVLWRRLDKRRLTLTLPWLLGAPLLTFVLGRMAVAGHVSSYEGTQLAVSSQTPRAWGFGAVASLPGATWPRANNVADYSGFGRFAVAAGLFAGACFLAWVWLARRTAKSEERAVGESAGAARNPLWALLPIAVIAVLAPVPFSVSKQWSGHIGVIGNSYMHTLIGLWCSAAAIAVLAIFLVTYLRRREVLIATTLAVVAWSTVQSGLNQQVAAQTSAMLYVGLDVTEVLESGSPLTPDERCNTLGYARSVEWADLWIDVLNREYEERFDEPYCEPQVAPVP